MIENGRIIQTPKEFIVKDLDDLKSFSLYLSKIITKDYFLVLHGEIASGKTTLVKFLCFYLEIEENVNSPTFNIMKRYWVKKFNCFLNHFDFFRLTSDEESSIFEEFKEGNINIIECADLSSSFWINEKKVIYLDIDMLPNDLRKISLRFT